MEIDLRRALKATAIAVTVFPSIVFGQSLIESLPPNPAERSPVPPVDTPTTRPSASAVSVPKVGTSALVLKGISLSGARAVPVQELAFTWQEFVGKPVSVGVLEAIAARVEAEYRSRGFVLSQVILPAQNVTNGIVKLTVVEGFVDQVSVTGGKAAQQKYAIDLFKNVPKERPLQLETLERAVLLSRDSMGGTDKTVKTVLSPSVSTFGAADLDIQIEPDPWTGFVAADNRGSRLYNSWTLIAGGTSYDLFGLNDRIDFSAALAPDGGSLAFGGFDLGIPIPDWDGTQFEFAANISRSDPDLSKSGAPNSLRVTLDEWNVHAGLMVPLIRSRPENLFGRFSLQWRDSQDQTIYPGLINSTTEDRLAVAEARLTWDKVDRSGGINFVDAALRQGLNIGSAQIGAEGFPAAGVADFTSVKLSLARLQKLGTGDWSVLAEFQGQYAADTLPNSERFALGGSTIGRGFAPGNTSGDSGYGLRLEFRRQIENTLKSNAIRDMELYFYGDYGRAYDRQITRDGVQWESLASAGLGMRIDMQQNWTLTPEVTRQLEGVSYDTTNTDLETRFFISAVKRF